jgi:hypothetical protein
MSWKETQMRKIAWLFLLGTLPVAAATTTAKPGNGVNMPAAASESPAPAHPVTAAKVHAILALTGTDTLKREMLDGMLPHLKQMMPYMPADVVVDFQRSLGTADFEGAMVRSFQQHLSAEDADAIVAFYQSPAGKHMITVMPKILNEGQDAGSELGQQVMFEVIQRHKDEINAAARVYHEEHPATAPQH